MRVDRWIERADEPCPFCLQVYALEAGARCVACDRPVCPLCVVRVRAARALLCPDCEPPEEGR